jgi:AraC-like DNA-binding protein
VLPAGIPHSLWSDGPWENVCVLYAGAGSLIDARARTIPVGAVHRVRRWLGDLCGLYDKRPDTPGPAADALLLAILADVAEQERRSHRLRSFHPRLAVAVDYLHDRTEARVSADDLARATRTSYSHLSALFRARFGCGPLDYHRQRRMERAQNLLLDPYVGVGEVARRLGFDDPSYFVRVFRQSVGVSPNRWRRHAGRGRETDRRPA